MDSLNFDSVVLYNAIIEYGTRLIGGLLVLIIGLWLAGLLTNALSKVMDKKDVDESLKPFLKGLVNALLKVIVVLTVFGTLGIEMTSFIAILGGLGLAIGMALSGTLQNFAGGVMILIFKPFKVGDFIDAQGYTGTVNEIRITATVLKTPDNKTIIIPNGPLSNGSMVNFSTETKRRVDFVFGIAYGDDSNTAKNLLLKLIQEDPRIDSLPEPFVRISELADSSVNITVRLWADAANYWDIHFDLIEKVYLEFPKAGLNIPFPQMDVHLIKD
jgi:small conductance mechanosensitive channel